MLTNNRTMNTLRDWIKKDSIHSDTMIKQVRDYYNSKEHRILEIHYTRMRLHYNINIKKQKKGR